MDGETDFCTPRPAVLAVGGVIPGGGDKSSAFTLYGAEPSTIPVLIGVPHAGRCYPPDVRDAMRGGETTRVRLEDRYADLLAHEVARQTGAQVLVAAAPRAMLDLNRARDDVDWSMVTGKRARGGAPHSLANRRARSGLGLVPRRLPGLGEIWQRPLDHEELDRRIEQIHRPYHAFLARRLEQVRDRWGAALLIDLHSMPPLSSKYPGDEAAEFVIGDRFGSSCDPALSALALAHLARSGRRVSHNRPYSGGYILERHAAPARHIHALQLEVCRSLYLDARLDQPTARLPGLAKLLAELVLALARQTADIAPDTSTRLAAE